MTKLEGLQRRYLNATYTAKGHPALRRIVRIKEKNGFYTFYHMLVGLRTELPPPDFTLPELYKEIQTYFGITSFMFIGNWKPRKW